MKFHSSKSTGGSIIATAIVVSFLIGNAVTWIAKERFLSSESIVEEGLKGHEREKKSAFSTNVEQPLISEALLPTSAIPEHYDLWLKAYLPGYGATFPNEKNLTFDGKVVVSLEVNEPMDKITLNSKFLKYSKEESFVELSNEKKVKILDIILKEKLEKVEFVLEEKIEKGKVKLSIEYSGEISDKLIGLYQTKYTTANGEIRIAAVTQMESTHARSMVPCFDEPLHKAIWSVRIVHPKGTTALSNGIELGTPQMEEEGFQMTRFKETPRMSSYLLAVLISEFKYIEAFTKSGVRFRVWSRPEALGTASYALEAGVKCLEGYEDFYGIPFPMSKQDMVAIPDFSAGAMENWGLITYRESVLLYDERNYFYSDKQRVAEVIAHELAHQWFGNLVTMKWWDDIWLNEGFATFVENIGIDIIANGAFQMEKQFVMNEQKETMELDATAASHPIFFPISFVYEMATLFDVISYKKGSSLLSMIREVMGKKSFNEGLKNYLTKYSYKNAEHGDLFNEWDQVVPDDLLGPDGRRLNITDFASKWTHQMGYPLLSLEKINKTTSKVVQKRYKTDKEAKEREKFAFPPYGYKWDMPVWIQKGENVEMRWLPAEGELLLETTGEEEAIVLNAESHSIARMQYSEKGWKRIFRQLEENPTIYSERTRYRIVDDVFAMAAIGQVDYSLPFELTKYMQKENDFLVWEAFINNINELRSYFGSAPQKIVIDDYMNALINPVSRRFPIKKELNEIKSEESFMEHRLAVLIFKERCSVDTIYCQKMINEYMKESFFPHCDQQSISSECSQIPSAVRSIVYCSFVKQGDENDFHMILDYYKRETLQLEKNRLMEALTCTRDPVIMKWILTEIFNRKSDVFRLQDLYYLSIDVSKNPLGAEMVLGHLLSNWEKFYKDFSDIKKVLMVISMSFTSQIRDYYSLNQLKEFLESHPETKDFYVLEEKKQLAEKRIRWLEKNGHSVIHILDRRLVQISSGLL